MHQYGEKKGNAQHSKIRVKVASKAWYHHKFSITRENQLTTDVTKLLIMPTDSNIIQ